MSLTDQIRAVVRDELAVAGISQAEAARALGVSTKHMSQMLTGRVGMSPEWADRITALCGRQLVIASTPTRAEQMQEGAQ